MSISGTLTDNEDQCCGQILEHFREAFPTNKKAVRICEIWEKYHLNDLRPECEHQRELGWPEQAAEKVLVTTYKLKPCVLLRQNHIEERSLESLRDTGKAVLTPEERSILKLPYLTKHPETYGPDNYEPDEAEEKTLGWLKPAEHPRGILCKPCPVCGYNYGSEWRYMPIPPEVIEEIMDW